MAFGRQTEGCCSVSVPRAIAGMMYSYALELAALGADVVEIVHKQNYLRGRTMGEINELISQGAAHAGVEIERAHNTELGGLVSLAGQARDGDVVAIMTHQDREILDHWLLGHGGSRDSADVLRSKVVSANPDRARHC